jgi:hypothetical protein
MTCRYSRLEKATGPAPRPQFPMSDRERRLWEKRLARLQRAEQDKHP